MQLNKYGANVILLPNIKQYGFIYLNPSKVSFIKARHTWHLYIKYDNMK